ncbi:hypothetical protein [Paraclostridium bifermentans]|uniref:hypothetical protein n=1 Tax=Paraclostridium bifermentans TaxID=1490 RepID=UPI00359C3B3C
MFNNWNFKKHTIMSILISLGIGMYIAIGSVSSVGSIEGIDGGPSAMYISYNLSTAVLIATLTLVLSLASYNLIKK